MFTECLCVCRTRSLDTFSWAQKCFALEWICEVILVQHATQSRSPFRNIPKMCSPAWRHSEAGGSLCGRAPSSSPLPSLSGRYTSSGAKIALPPCNFGPLIKPTLPTALDLSKSSVSGKQQEWLWVHWEQSGSWKPPRIWSQVSASCASTEAHTHLRNNSNNAGGGGRSHSQL